MQLKISNVCACVQLNKSVSLSQVLVNFPDACYVGNNYKFKSIKVILKNFNGTAMISSNGKIVLVGCDSVLGAEEYALFLFATLEGLSPSNFRISNIVCTAYTPYRIRLDLLHKYLVSYGRKATYEPEIDAPCINIKYLLGTARMYRTGNMIITGAKSQQNVMKIFTSLVNDLKSYINK